MSTPTPRMAMRKMTRPVVPAPAIPTTTTPTWPKWFRTSGRWSGGHREGSRPSPTTWQHKKFWNTQGTHDFQNQLGLGTVLINYVFHFGISIKKLLFSCLGIRLNVLRTSWKPSVRVRRWDSSASGRMGQPVWLSWPVNRESFREPRRTGPFHSEHYLERWIPRPAHFWYHFWKPHTLSSLIQATGGFLFLF